jgi:hypothetical protein
MSSMHNTVTTKRTGRSILLQWTLVVVFFLPIWLVYVCEISPGLRPDSRLSLDMAVPAGLFVVCVVTSFALRAWHGVHKGFPTT